MRERKRERWDTTEISDLCRGNTGAQATVALWPLRPRALEGQEGLAGWSVTLYSDHWRLALLSHIGVIHPVTFGNAGILSVAGWGGGPSFLCQKFPQVPSPSWMSKGIPRTALVGTRSQPQSCVFWPWWAKATVTRLGSLGSGSNNYLGELSLAMNTVSNSSFKKTQDRNK